MEVAECDDFTGICLLTGEGEGSQVKYRGEGLVQWVGADPVL